MRRGSIMQKKIDIHVHANLQGRARENRPGSTTITPEDFKSVFEKLGIGKAVNLPTFNPEYPSQLRFNEEACRLVQKYPDMFYWFCNINPKLIENKPDIDFSDYISFFKKLGAKGVGEITANVYFDEPLIQNLFMNCEKYDMPVLFHIGPQIGGCYGLVDDPGLPRLEKSLAKFPKLKFIGHSQPFWSEISSDLLVERRNYYPKGKVIPGRTVELLRKYPNLYGDMSAYSGYNAMSRDPEFAYSFIEEFQDRLFYGTDINDPEHIKMEMCKLSAWLDEAYSEGNISKIAYEKVCYGNALDLLES